MIGVLGLIFLAVSLVSLLTQAGALGRLRSWPQGATGHHDGEVFRGLLRTSLCRVLAAVLYVAMGAVTLIAADTLPVLALSVFTAVQILWQGNAIADLRLRRRLAEQARTDATEQPASPSRPAPPSAAGGRQQHQPPEGDTPCRL